MSLLTITCCLDPTCPGLIAGHADELRADPLTAPIMKILDQLLKDMTPIIDELAAASRREEP